MAATSRCADNEPQAAAPENKREKQKAFDKALLRDVAATDPFRLGVLKRGSGWREVADRLSSQLKVPVSERRARERMEDMLTDFRRKNALNQSQSGIEEDFTEEDRALIDVSELKAAAEAGKATLKAAATQKKTTDKGLKIREQAMTGMAKRPAETAPGSSSKKSKNQLVTLFREKEENKAQFRNQQLALMQAQVAATTKKEEENARKAEQDKQVLLEELTIKERMAEEERKLRREEMEHAAKREEEERKLRLEEMEHAAKREEEERKLRLEEMEHAAKREEEERKLRLEEMRLRDAREREAAERQMSLFQQMMKAIIEKK